MKKNLFYPLFLDLSDRPSIIVGGGSVAERKARMLLKFGGKVKVVSPRFTKGLQTLAEKGRIEILKKEFEEKDLDGAYLVFAATDKRELNERIKESCKKRGILVNVVDNPELCDFFVPSIVKRGSIIIAISTSGKVPAISKRIRKEIEKKIDFEFLKYVEILANFRKFLMKNIKDQRKRSEIMKEVAKKNIKKILFLGLKGLKKRYKET